MRKNLYPVIKGFLILLSVLATVKICFFNLNIDEEYAVTMAYRMANGDRMFLDIWAPHQTSGFLSAALIKMYLFFSGSSEYLVLFLRLAGTIIQAGISLFLYSTLKKYFTEIGAFVAAIFFYNTLPKWIQTPEFSNMLVWFSVLTMLCFLHAYHASKYTTMWFVLAGVFASCLVLAYPSCIFAVVLLILVMKKIRRETYIHDVLVVLGTCCVLGICYLGYFLSHMTLKDFIFGLQQMMTDGSHSATLLQRSVGYVQEVISLAPHILLIMFVAGAIIWWKNRRNRATPEKPLWLEISLISLILSLVEQVVIWLSGSRFIHYPLIYFYLLWALGVVVYKKLADSKGTVAHTLVWIGSGWGMLVWFSALLITNTTISVTGSYLMTGLLAGIVLISQACEGYNTELIERSGIYMKALLRVAMLFLMGTTLFAKGFLICENEGVCSNIFFVRQKALTGVSKNIYYRYMDGFVYNVYVDEVSPYIDEDDALLYIGSHSLYYLVNSPIISTYSTISTPTFGDRLHMYWERNPERYPDFVVVEAQSYLGEDVMNLLESLGARTTVFENEWFVLYRIGE